MEGEVEETDKSAWEFTAEFIQLLCSLKREKKLHDRWRNQNKSRMRFRRSQRAKVCMDFLVNSLNPHVIGQRELSCCMRVDKRQFVSVFSQVSCLAETRTRVAWKLMTADKREFL